MFTTTRGYPGYVRSKGTSGPVDEPELGDDGVVGVDGNDDCDVTTDVDDEGEGTGSYTTSESGPGVVEPESLTSDDDLSDSTGVTSADTCCTSGEFSMSQFK